MASLLIGFKEKPNVDLLIETVNIIDIEGDSILNSQYVLIPQDSIFAIGDETLADQMLAEIKKWVAEKEAN